MKTTNSTQIKPPLTFEYIFPNFIYIDKYLHLPTNIDI